MFRLVTSVLAALLLVTQPVSAEETTDADFARYAALVGVSPFGGSLNMAYNFSRQNTVNVALGGLPGGMMAMEVDVDGTKFDVEGSSSWVGAFINHRPVEGAEWFRVVAGIGIGSIENELTDAAGNRYRADYNDNPVGYLGVGLGNAATKGFQIGFDLGWLQTSGPEIELVEAKGTPDPKAAENIADHMFFGNVLPNVQLTLGWGF